MGSQMLDITVIQLWMM